MVAALEGSCCPIKRNRWCFDAIVGPALILFAFDVFLAGTAMSFPTFFHFLIMHAAAMHFRLFRLNS